ncbi:hypothetical protein TYRP_018376 [Tyrophagus putrescentiae]|nr:hypothetical protein TYRP_018376 [Tyrophagus putrescentiae]
MFWIFSILYTGLNSSPLKSSSSSLSVSVYVSVGVMLPKWVSATATPGVCDGGDASSGHGADHAVDAGAAQHRAGAVGRQRGEAAQTGGSGRCRRRRVVRAPVVVVVVADHVCEPAMLMGMFMFMFMLMFMFMFMFMFMVLFMAAAAAAAAADD